VALLFSPDSSTAGYYSSLIIGEDVPSDMVNPVTIEMDPTKAGDGTKIIGDSITTFSTFNIGD